MYKTTWKKTETTLLDPFMGIGSSGVAAKRQGIAKFVGVEIDEEYYTVAEKRIKNGM